MPDCLPAEGSCRPRDDLPVDRADELIRGIAPAMVDRIRQEVASAQHRTEARISEKIVANPVPGRVDGLRSEVFPRIQGLHVVALLRVGNGTRSCMSHS